MSVQHDLRPPDMGAVVARSGSQQRIATLADIVECGPTRDGPDRRTLRAGLLAVLATLAFVVFFGAVTGLLLYRLLVSALAYLT